MSNWKVGPGGRLYHPTTGAYVGQLDLNGNEQMVLGITTTSAQGIEIAVRAANFSAYIPYVLSFPDFAPSVLASFVNGTTAAQVGNTVTVTAAAHGMLGNATKNGYRIYFPGSPNIPAGWYSGFAWIDVNTVTFQRAVAATVSSESVNGGAAFVAQVTICSLTLPGGAMGPNGKISLCSLRSSEGAITKFLRLAIGAQVVHGISVGGGSGEGRMTMRNIGSESVQRVSSAIDGTTVGTPPYTFTLPMSVDQVVNVVAKVEAAGGWVSVDGCELEVVKQ